MAKLEAAGFITMKAAGRRKTPSVVVKKIVIEIDPYSDRLGLLQDIQSRRDLSVHHPYAILALEDLAVPTPSATRDDRIELRTSREEKRVLADAVAYERLDLTCT